MVEDTADGFVTPRAGRLTEADGSFGDGCGLCAGCGWLASTYTPQIVHGVEPGIVLFSVGVAAAHIFVLKAAEKAS
ncbi:MAG: hypothetical protein QOF07_660 [Bradyrhizobium sp.]|jgi:hypothetical protein|nr:hypothetical protein [Bradyrhizobium sp.]